MKCDIFKDVHKNSIMSNCDIYTRKCLHCWKKIILSLVEKMEFMKKIIKMYVQMII